MRAKIWLSFAFRGRGAGADAAQCVQEAEIKAESVAYARASASRTKADKSRRLLPSARGTNLQLKTSNSLDKSDICFRRPDEIYCRVNGAQGTGGGGRPLGTQARRRRPLRLKHAPTRPHPLPRSLAPSVSPSLSPPHPPSFLPSLPPSHPLSNPFSPSLPPSLPPARPPARPPAPSIFLSIFYTHARAADKVRLRAARRMGNPGAREWEGGREGGREVRREERDGRTEIRYEKGR